MQYHILVIGDPPPWPESTALLRHARRSLSVAPPYICPRLCSPDAPSVTQILLASAKLSLLDSLGAIHRRLPMTLRTEAILILEHGARVGDRGAGLPEVGVKAENCVVSGSGVSKE